MRVRYGRFSKKHDNQAATGRLIVKFMTTILPGNAYNYGLFLAQSAILGIFSHFIVKSNWLLKWRKNFYQLVDSPNGIIMIRIGRPYVDKDIGITRTKFKFTG